MDPIVCPGPKSARDSCAANQLLKSTDRFTRMQIYYTGERSRAEKEHQEIVRLCEAGKFKLASKVLCKHIKYAGTTLSRMLRNQRSKGNAHEN